MNVRMSSVLKNTLSALAGLVVIVASQSSNAQVNGYYGYGYVTCSTISNGQRFQSTATSIANREWARQTVINTCRLNPYSDFTECYANARCSSDTVPVPSYPTPNYPLPYPTPTYPNPYPPSYPPTYPPPTYPPSFPKPAPNFPYGATVLSPSGRTWAHLQECGGTVELNTRGGQVNLVFRNVRDCSKFDILAANGSPINYGMKSLGGSHRDRNGSFTLPRSVIDWGRNGVLVQMRSNSGIHSDELYLNFYAY